MKKRFKEHLIYEHDEDMVLIYLCLEDINLNKFTAHILTIVSQLNSKTTIGDMHDRLVESLYYDGCPSNRFEWFDTIDKAIDAFNNENEP